MALIQTDTIFYFHNQGVEGEITVAGGQISANNGGLAYIFQAEEAAVITRISLRVSAMPNTPNADLSVGLQDLNATGFPSGNWLVGASGATNTTNFAPEPGTSTGVKTYTLPASVTLTAGQIFAIVVRNAVSGYSGDISFNFTHFTRASVGFPYTTRRASGVWAAKGNLMPSHAFYGSATKWYGNCGLSTSEGTGTVPSGATEFGWTFQMPAGHPNVRLHGIMQKFASYTAASTFNLVVRNTAGASLATGTYDCDYTSPSGYYPCILDADVWLTSGTKYYLMFQASTGTAPGPRNFTGFTAAILPDVSDGIISHSVTYNGTTFNEGTGTRLIGTLIFSGLQYNQTGGTTQYIIPSGFNSIG